MEICGKKDYWEQVVYYKKYMFGFGARSRLIAEIVKRNSDKIESVLELGCNSGNNLQEINNLVPNIKLSGLDLSEPAINFGKTVDKNPAELVAGDLMDLSRFEDKSFDLVFTSGVLLYLSPTDVIKVLKETIRISKRFIFNIELHGKHDCLIDIIKGDKFKIKIFSVNYRNAYKKLGHNAEVHSLINKLPKVKNTKHLVVVNLTDDKLRVFDG